MPPARSRKAAKKRSSASSKKGEESVAQKATESQSPADARKVAKEQAGTTSERKPPSGAIVDVPSLVPGVGTPVAVHVDDLTARSDDDVHQGHFCVVTGGEHAGRVGVYVRPITAGKDGWPDKVAVYTRDARKETIEVKYSDLKPTLAGVR